MATLARRRLARFAASPLVAALAALPSGCCQPCYAPAMSGCPPVAAAPATVRYGDVCQTPAAASSAVAQAAPANSSGSVTIVPAPRPRVVVSEPGSGRLAGRSGWRRSDPERTVRLEGALDDESTIR